MSETACKAVTREAGCIGGGGVVIPVAARRATGSDVGAASARARPPGTVGAVRPAVPERMTQPFGTGLVPGRLSPPSV